MSTIQHDERTEGIDKPPADVQLEPITVIEDPTSNTATDLQLRHQTQDGDSVNTIIAKIYNIYTSIDYTKMYSKPAVLDTGCSLCLTARSILRPDLVSQEHPPPLIST